MVMRKLRRACRNPELRELRRRRGEPVCLARWPRGVCGVMAPKSLRSALRELQRGSAELEAEMQALRSSTR